MVAMEWTPRLESAFKRLQDRKKSLSSTSTSFTPDETKTAQEVDTFLSDTKKKECVDLDLVKRVSALLLKYSSSTGDASGVGASSEDWIHIMVKGSTVYVPKAAPKERSPELEKLMDTYKSQLASKEYSRMISSIDPNSLTSSTSSTIAYNLRQDMKDLKDVKAHSIGIVNVLYTGAAVFTAVFMISAHFTEDLGMRVLLSFLAFVGIVACEAYLYHRHAQTAAGGSKVKRVKALPEDVVIKSVTIGKEKYA
ncbi:hypothetical protein K457DRAFT_141008 [Linnemannia elongata AG-77]|uniref:Endoplasmic reticulum-based factor for assembly of V-ATPase n=1 Tax=Linnemannia elongata AG-77 TaxID=1314771 RepID=A0A197JKM6_9FUNG|nr:hypothetical protein K457DRAFT_141008 [Linnemannia elongata AG-77]